MTDKNWSHERSDMDGHWILKKEALQRIRKLEFERDELCRRLGELEEGLKNVIYEAQSSGSFYDIIRTAEEALSNE